MRPHYKSAFLAFVKKQPRPFQLAIEDAVEDVCTNPEIGVPKKGDLQGFRIHKFRYQRQQFLLAYCLSPPVAAASTSALQGIDFYLIGPHENFCSSLKKYLKS